METLTSNVPQALLSLWRRRARLLATNVATGSREHREIAHAASLIGKDYQDRFLIELIQNANDQAILGDARGSTVVVVRSENLLAVSNAGQVVNSGNLERLSSLADSDKTGILVGNKGVGFKAVYQVTDTPEIYSAAEARLPQSNVFDHLHIGIALEREPFRYQQLVDVVEDEVRTFFDDNTGLARTLADGGVKDAVGAVRAEFPHVAGFKFPIPRGPAHLAEHKWALNIPEAYLKDIRTLVVLPLRDQQARNDVRRAIDALVGAASEAQAHAALAVLFLKGIGQLVVIDLVTDNVWKFNRSDNEALEEVQQLEVAVTQPDGSTRSNGFWLIRRDLFACDETTAAQRRAIVAAALEGFGLEAWEPDDPIPVSVALPRPTGGAPTPLGPPGRFCLGLPTEQSTGLPAHVDTRFFATISRTGLDFTLPYNELLLSMAAELFEVLLTHLKQSPDLNERRAVTLALHRSAGELAEQVYAAAGVRDGEVVLSWGGMYFLRRTDCQLPDEVERTLLPYIADSLYNHTELLATLPEAGLLASAANVLESIGLSPLEADPHPLLARENDSPSAIERAARVHRSAGPEWWEPFVTALLDCFESNQLEAQAWLPVGQHDLAAPQQRVFLPASSDSQGDDDEVATVPPAVSAMLGLLDGAKMRLREDGRALTSLALRLADKKLVRRPRKIELLEDALFPALEKAAEGIITQDVALDLFGQAIAWIISMREASRRKLDCEKARVPIVTPDGINWEESARCYLGTGWDLSEKHDQLLENAYPDQRLLPFIELATRFQLSNPDAPAWRKAAETMKVNAIPKVTVYPGKELAPPLESSHYKLRVKGTPTLKREGLDSLYRQYVEYLSRFPTPWDWSFPHNVDEVIWIEGLEDSGRREYILDLMLEHPDTFLSHTSVILRRIGDNEIRTVQQFWVFALAKLGWPVFPSEQGAGGISIRTPAQKLWRLPDSARRSAYARLLKVVPQSLAGTWTLLGKLGVASLDEAPIARLFDELTELAQRLDEERLHSRREALSLASELYARLEVKLQGETEEQAPNGLVLPLLWGKQLRGVCPSEQSDCVIVFDDDPVRGRHVLGRGSAFRIPIARDTSIDGLYELFFKTWGTERVIRTSTARVELNFSVGEAPPMKFQEWLQERFPRVEVAIELAALLTLGGEHTLRAERVSRRWKDFESLNIEVGSFQSPEIKSFYDRTTDTLKVSLSLTDEDIVAATWELAGVRSRILWRGYAHALREGMSKEFLDQCEISDVEIVDVADAAGLHRSRSVEGLEAALLAARCHLAPNTTLDDAVQWWNVIEHIPDEIAKTLGRPELSQILSEAIRKPAPEGEFLLLRHLSVPWSLWQDAVLRRDGRRYVFPATTNRYRSVRDHLIAIMREVGVRDTETDLNALGALVARLEQSEAPERVVTLPPDEANSDREAWYAIIDATSHFPAILHALESLPHPPWEDELPIPTKATTKRGVRLFREVPPRNREIEATTSIKAVVQVASGIASTIGEYLDPSSVLADPKLTERISGEWAHVYAALAYLRTKFESQAPVTVKKLSTVQAFRDPCTEASLSAKLPGIPRSASTPPPPKRKVLGVELTENDLRATLALGSSGDLGKKLAAAASYGLDMALLAAQRSPLPVRSGKGGGSGGHGGGSSGGKGHRMREPELIGDLGEAFIHEWLLTIPQLDYGPECWVSKARERYGLPACGDDHLGFDFKVPDPDGRLFGRPSSEFLIEVKSTSTDGSNPFPMSRPEWEKARKCHDAADEGVYVILRVFYADESPRIGDVLIDPFGAEQRGEVRLDDRDLWVTVAPLEHS